MRICFVSAEFYPFAKTGGLGDVSAALTRYLHRRGYEVRAFLPLYAPVLAHAEELTPESALRGVPIPVGAGTASFDVFTSPIPKSDLRIHLIHCDRFYDRPAVYTNDPDEHLRFAFLSRAALECCQRTGWAPDVIHCHDWHSALIPVYLRGPYAWDGLFRKSRTLLTLHNLGYQGVFPASVLQGIGLGEHAHLLDGDDLRGGRIGFLKNGLLHADRINTVSPTYAREIQTEEHGFGLHEVLRSRRDVLTGILNGVDQEEWNPETDSNLANRYSVDTLWRKGSNKRALLAEVGLREDDGVPLVGIVSRLAEQKGFDLLFESLPPLLGRGSLRMVVLGAGEPRYEASFAALEREFAGQVRFHRGHDDRLAHLIEAGADFFLMPSRYEPCGLNQMYSLRYGTVPIVRKTGGLADTVKPFDPATGHGTGIVFEHLTPDGLRWAIDQALGIYHDADAWGRIRRNGMAQDFSWERQGRHYESLYARLLEE